MSRNRDIQPRFVAVQPLALVLLVGAALQLVAAVVLGLASPRALHAVVRESPRAYVLVAVVIAVIAFATWLDRGRRRVGIIVVAMLTAAIGIRLWGASMLGLAYRGEALLHHFLTLLSCAVCIVIPSLWLREPTLGRRRWLPIGTAIVGSLALLTAHLSARDTTVIGGLGQVGTGLSLAAWPLALVGVWPRIWPARLRWWALVCAMPVVLRVVLGGSDALAGKPLGLTAATPIMVTIGVTAAVALVLLRPALEMGLRVLILASSTVMIFGVSRMYQLRFGDIESDLGGLVRSLFGFELPYPGYLSTWTFALAAASLITLLFMIGSAISAVRDHQRGLGVGLMACAGLGLSSPQTVVMLCAGYLILLDAGLTDPPQPGPVAQANDLTVDQVLAQMTELATGLSLPAPVSSSDGPRHVICVRDRPNGAIELRARRDKHTWQLVYRLGPPHETKPQLLIHCDDPTSPVCRGDIRRIERVRGELLQVLGQLPPVLVKIWPTGIRCEVSLAHGPIEPAVLRELHALLSELV